MDEPPRDNNILGLMAVVAVLLLSADTENLCAARLVSSFKRATFEQVKRIICVLRRIHSPHGFRLVC